MSLLLVSATAAFAADSLIADGDGVTPVNNNPLNLGSVCPGGAITPTADNVLLELAAINRNAGSWFGNSEEVTFSAKTIPSSLSATTDTITTASGWATIEGSPAPRSDTASVRVSLLDAGMTEGAQSANIEWGATGAGFTRSGGTTSANPDVEITQNMAVNWTVLSATDPACATAAPDPVTPDIDLEVRNAADDVAGTKFIVGTSVYAFASLSDDAEGDVTFQLFSGSNCTDLAGTKVGSDETVTLIDSEASSTATAALGAGSYYYLATYESSDTDLWNDVTDAACAAFKVVYDICVLYDQDKAVQANATVPIRLYLCDVNGDNVSDADVVVQATTLKRIEGLTSTVEILEDAGNANPDNNFRYSADLDDGNGGYIFNLSTKNPSPSLGIKNKLQSGQYRLKFSVDGQSDSTYAVFFSVK